MKKQKLTINEEISKIKRMMGKLLKEYPNLHLYDAIVEKIQLVIKEMVLEKLSVSSEYDIVPNPMNNKYDDEERLIYQDKPTHSHLRDEYDDMGDDFDSMSLADEIFDKIKNNYDDDEIKTWNNRPVPDEVTSYAKEKIKKYLDLYTFNNDNSLGDKENYDM